MLAAEQTDSGYLEGWDKQKQYLHIWQQEGRSHRQYQCSLRTIGGAIKNTVMVTM